MMTEALKIGLIGFGLMLFGWGGMIGLTVTLRREGEPWSEVRSALFDPRSHMMFVLGLVGAMVVAIALTQ
jgi:hypothetical protein